MKKIRIGHIGTFHDHSINTIRALKKLSDIFEVVGYVPESKERYDEIKGLDEYKDVKAMSLNELFDAGIDAAVIEGFEKELIPMAQQCVDKGIHVHIDKPAGDDITAFKTMLNCARDKKLIVQMGYVYRYNPAIKKALTIVKKGDLGKIYSVEAHMSCLHPVDKRKWLGNFPGGMMFFLGCHMIDIILQFQGIPKEILPLNRSINEDGVCADDFGLAILKYENGISIARTTAVEVNGFSNRRLLICGTKGTIEIHPLEKFTSVEDRDLLSADMNISKLDNVVGWDDCSQKIDVGEFDRYRDMMIEFANCIKGEFENPYTYDYEYELQKVILKACGVC